MKTDQPAPKNIDEYIAGFPDDIQAILEKLRATIHEAAPGVEETISYQMPTFKLKGALAYFAVWKKHVGFYGVPGEMIELFKDELAAYLEPKGSLKFPLDKPMPLDLISKIVKLRVEENLARTKTKEKKK